jgi:hypothetical protein
MAQGNEVCTAKSAPDFGPEFPQNSGFGALKCFAIKSKNNDRQTEPS